MKNFPRTWEESQLRELFEPYGEITSACLMREPGSNELRGFGFVNFKQHESAERAAAELHGRELPDEAAASSESGEPPMLHLYVSRAQKKAEREREKQKQRQVQQKNTLEQFKGRNVYIKRLDDNLDEHKLLEVFGRYGPITSTRIMRDENGASRGFGFVCFDRPEDATHAVQEMNGQVVGSKPIYVALAMSKVRAATISPAPAQAAA